MQIKTKYFGNCNYKKTIFLGKDGKWHVRECTCTRRSVCNLCPDSEDCALEPEGAGPLVAFGIMVILLFILMYSLMYLETIVPY